MKTMLRGRRSTLAGTASAAILSAFLVTTAWATEQHSMPGMDGNAAGATQAAPGYVIGRDAAEVPAPITRRTAATVKVHLETIEVNGQLNDGTTYNYWTFNGKVPGPMVRVRVGDTVEVSLTNNANNSMVHNVDFHAVTGPGGGGKPTSAKPGETKSFTFKALNPGLYVYHCATPMHAQHIANGMYGMILVEPEGGLPKVDHEFYVMQGEIYTEQPFGTKGEATESYDKLMNERSEYFVFNGAVGSLTKNPLKAKVGETVRIYFGVGGPNFTSSFHVIGEIFDKVYPLGSVTSETLSNVQTISVPPGGVGAVEFKLQEPGRYLLVDHALSRIERGLVGYLDVQGPADPSVFQDTSRVQASSGE